MFRGRSDLLLLAIDSNRVDATIRYENLLGGAELFPHIYGPLERSAVVAAERLLPRSDGTFDPASIERCLAAAGLA